MSEVFVIDLAKAKPESAPSAKPPKAWWDKKYQEVKEGNPDYSDEQIRGTVGSIWYEKMSPSQKKTRREKEGKTYGKVKKSMMHVIDIQKSQKITPEAKTPGALTKKPKPTKTENIDRDGNNAGNQGKKDYFGDRDVYKKNPKKKNKGGVLNKSDYFSIYINKKGALGGEPHATHLDGVKSQPVLVNSDQPERNIEVRPAEQGSNRLANQDAFDQATQGELVRLQTSDEAIVTYISVHGKHESNLIGFEGNTADRAEFAAGQGDQSQLKSVPVLGNTEWTAEIIPKKTMKKSNPSKCNLFATAPENPDLIKSISQGNLVSDNLLASRAHIPDPGDQKYYDYANAFISVLHKSYRPDSILGVLHEKAKTNQLLAKSITVCGIDSSYVIYQASTLYKENNSTGASDYAVQKALSHFA